LDNIRAFGTSRIVTEVGTGKTLLGNSDGPISWIYGKAYTNSFPLGRNLNSSDAIPLREMASKPQILLTPTGKFLSKEKPQYQDIPKSGFLNVVTEGGAKNDGTNSKQNAYFITEALKKAVAENRVALFPSGSYIVEDTIEIPIGSRIVGTLWSQIMATGDAFSDVNKPKVLAEYVFARSLEND
jgi:glucan 1,3-beta-glucosidase